jgi:hypothetical protein
MDRSPRRAERRRVVPCSRALAVVLCLCSFPGAARADGRGIDLSAPRARDDGFALELGVDATVPLAVAARMQLEMPGRVLGRFVLGGLPDALAAGYADLGASVGGWDAATRDTVADALGGALYLEAAVGVRPFEDAGLELAVGYVLVWAQARTTFSGVAVAIETGSHAVHATLGWRALLGDLVFFRIEAGWLHTVGASAAVGVEQPSAEPPGMEAELEAELVRRGFGPTLSISAGLHLP